MKDESMTSGNHDPESTEEKNYFAQIRIIDLEAKNLYT
jgi:hypothetical protein